VNGRGRDRDAHDRGAADVLGLVLIFPAILGFALLLLFLGRQVDATAQLQAASDAAARAAAQERGVDDAIAAATAAAASVLTDARACPGGPQIQIDAGGWRPGGQVSVTVTCTPRRDDLDLIAPPQRILSATSSASIDRYRAPDLP